MTCNFRVGQKVVCVDDRGGGNISKGTVYTVSQVYPCNGYSKHLGFSKYAILLVEAAPSSGLDAFHPKRFRPVVKRKTDISIFKAMLEDKKARADA